MRKPWKAKPAKVEPEKPACAHEPQKLVWWCSGHGRYAFEAGKKHDATCRFEGKTEYECLDCGELL